ncbi:hypothetical protein TSUD_274040 [Trifolium subterraneum]|uniref:Uncharacterized protein n=1 Tax=Trifolium subterraneum TaxID=3900 RepID=A0A2Z6MNJ4_TRISU|nr:hypothetical protein TSUD_274040 [Trifolium subterraneum]
METILQLGILGFNQDGGSEKMEGLRTVGGVVGEVEVEMGDEGDVTEEKAVD